MNTKTGHTDIASNISNNIASNIAGNIADSAILLEILLAILPAILPAMSVQVLYVDNGAQYSRTPDPNTCSLQVPV